MEGKQTEVRNLNLCGVEVTSGLDTVVTRPLPALLQRVKIAGWVYLPVPSLTHVPASPINQTKTTIMTHRGQKFLVSRTVILRTAAEGLWMKRIAPGFPYTPSAGGESVNVRSVEVDRGRWRLDECLRFATELAGRKVRRRNWEGLADEMTRAGWFETV